MPGWDGEGGRVVRTAPMDSLFGCGYVHSEREGESMAERIQQAALSTLEICAGGGGAALGLELAGFAHAALLDNDPHACATLRRNRPYWNVIEADVRRFDPSYWRGIDLLSGGLPCPPFSIAGKQLGENDDRNLFPAMMKIVEETQPRAILIENVRGILTEKFAPFRASINKELGALGFDAYWMGFNAVEFGVPQMRFRAFLVALRRGVTKPLQWPIPMQGLAPSVGEAIGDMMGAAGWQHAPEWAKRASAPAPTIVGGSHKHGGPDLGPTRARREWAELGVDGLGLANSPPPRNFEGMPRLTVPMVARLQSFPDDWVFCGSKTHAYRQVGNALPVRLACAIARAVRRCLV
jgi:DNA (cytosine-5)-methyltransferase 1